MVLAETQIRERQRSEYKKLKKIIKTILDHHKYKETVWFQSRLKTEESIREKESDNRELNDVIGFRLIHLYTPIINELVNILKRTEDLKIFKENVSEAGKVIYLYGKTSSDDIYEIQLWTTIIYTSLKCEHEKIYKSQKSVSPRQLGISLKLKEDQHVMQTIIDNSLTPIAGNSPKGLESSNNSPKKSASGKNILNIQMSKK